jgi:hypothetical protein
MTDDELERRLRAHYQAIDPTLAPPGLGRRIDDSLDRPSSRPAIRTRTRSAFAVVVVAVLIVAVGLGLRPGGYLSSAGSPSPTAFPSAPRPTSQASGTSPAPTPLPPGPDVQAGGLLDATHGWALTDKRLLITADGGATWRDVTPTAGKPGRRHNCRRPSSIHSARSCPRSSSTSSTRITVSRSSVGTSRKGAMTAISSGRPTAGGPGRPTVRPAPATWVTKERSASPLRTMV